MLCPLQQKFLPKTSCNQGAEPDSEREARPRTEKERSLRAEMPGTMGRVTSESGQLSAGLDAEARPCQAAAPARPACGSPAALGLRNCAFCPDVVDQVASGVMS